MKKKAVVYLHSGLADWESSFVLPELKKAGYEVLTVATARTPVETMGGLKIIPDLLVSEIRDTHPSILILPGGDSWNDPSNNSEIISFIPIFLDAGTMVAAICGAVTALARIGILNNIRHTSNYLPMLKEMVPTYSGESLHTDNLAEYEKNVITASGIGALEFTYQILKSLGVYKGEKADEWLNFYKNGVPPSWLFAPSVP